MACGSRGPGSDVAGDKLLVHTLDAEGGEGAQVEHHFEGARPAAAIEGIGLEPGLHHAYIGNDPAKWVTSVRTFASVRL